MPEPVLVCVGAVLLTAVGPVAVDETPVMVREAIREGADSGEEFLEFNYRGVSIYVGTSAPILAINARFGHANRDGTAT